MEYLDEMKINKALVLEFFFVLSRIEFALKVTGYVCGNKAQVKPDWNRFADTIENRFNCESNDELATACRYYLDHPPEKQILKDDMLTWECKQSRQKSNTRTILVLVRRVRNNLFHGGKYNAQNHKEYARNEKLLSYGICILQESVSLIEEVKQAYKSVAV